MTPAVTDKNSPEEAKMKAAMADARSRFHRLRRAEKKQQWEDYEYSLEYEAESRRRNLRRAK